MSYWTLRARPGDVACHVKLTAFGAGIFPREAFIAESAPLIGRMRAAMVAQVPLIRAFIGYLTDDSQNGSQKCPHNSSGRSSERTNGDSSTLASFDPLRIANQIRTESTRINSTSTMKIPQTTVSRWSLKICPRVSAIFEAAILPESRALWRLVASARNPKRGWSEKIFSHPAVKQTVTSQASGIPVIHM